MTPSNATRPATLGEHGGAGGVLHVLFGGEQVEERVDGRRLDEEAADEAGELVEAADQQVGEADEAHDLADA